MVHPSRHIPGFMVRAAEGDLAPAPAKAKRVRAPKPKAKAKKAARPKAAPKPPKALVDRLREKIK